MELTQGLRQAITEYKGGRAEAFTPLYEESCKYIYTCIYKVMSGNDNAQDAINDIMQDTYVEISRYISQLEDEEKFLSWAGTIATRKCYAYLKKSNKYVLLNEEDNTFENISDDDNIIPEEVMQDKEKQRLIREIIDTELTQMQKLCVVAYYYNEQKQSEIAQELGIPENTVKTNLSRAKAKIKNGVLDLEKNKYTKLYSAVPLFLLLFREEAYAANVPQETTQGVMSALSAQAGAVTQAGATSQTGMAIGKAAASSVKKKIIAGVAVLGMVGVATTAVFLTADEDKNSIPEGAGYFDGHYYYVYDFDDYEWNEAKEYCESLGGHLATITSEEENEYVYQYMKDSDYKSAYIGLTDSENEGEWKWVTGEEVEYTNWSAKEPNSENKNEDYAMFYYKFKTGVWNDGDFGKSTAGKVKSFICEWDED